MNHDCYFKNGPPRKAELDSHARAMGIELLRRGYALRIKAQGRSMLPSIWPGDVLTIQPDGKLMPGDIVAFEDNGDLVVHRLLSRSVVHGASYWTSRGDAVDADDPLWPDAAVLGKIICVEGARRTRRPAASLSLTLSAAAWALGRFASLRNLMLRIHSALGN